jgi:hypothetical protein
MIAMLLAAQLSAELMRGMPADVVAPDVTTYRHAALGVFRNGPPVRPELICPPQGAMQTSEATPSLLLRPQDRRDARARKLADLPRANKEIAVARTVDGCAVPVGVRYGVEGDGRFAKGDGQ